MKSTKKRKLEANGWRVGNTDEFLSLTPEESEYIAMKMSLSKSLQKARARSKMTQKELAVRLNSSQSRVAKMESGDPSVSVDLLVRSLFALGVTRKAVGRLIGAEA